MVKLDKLAKPKNINKVDKGRWKKWTIDGRNLFNDLYATSLSNERIMNHTDTILLGDERWNTVAWNHAWLAADYISMRQKGTVKID